RCLSDWSSDVCSSDLADLLRVAADYAELHARAATISPQAAAEVQRISATHGPMGYPVAVGIVTNLARQQAALDAKTAQFDQYSRSEERRVGKGGIMRV